jgi:signal transduction histidine kinase
VETRISDMAGQSNRYFIFSVKDNGIGINPSDVKSIFLRRFTTKERKTGSGLGYGLWWVKSFVTRTKGYIMVDPNPGTGAKFEIRIPLNVPATQSQR